MRLSPAAAFRITALLGFLAVALGAFGAHGLEAHFAQYPKTRDWWEKAVFYQFVHTLAMLGLARSEPFRAGVWGLFAAGIVIFSGSLYVLSMTGHRWLGAVTPLGGLCFLAGWLWLAFGGVSPRDRA